MIASDKGMKLIAGFSILVESSGNCQQSAGSFDQLDSQWNITQCVHEQVRLSSWTIAQSYNIMLNHADIMLKW